MVVVLFWPLLPLVDLFSLILHAIPFLSMIIWRGLLDGIGNNLLASARKRRGVVDLDLGKESTNSREMVGFWLPEGKAGPASLLEKLSFDEVYFDKLESC
uniref:Uncharacterized protein n=1 Tax=Cannabis sativa TaxID=3483 RepID=A0A803PHP7_CANSA